MNGLDESVDLSPLLGAEVLQVCVGLHQLQIHFDSRISLMIESECVLRRANSEAIRVDAYATAASEICALLGQKITRASRTKSGGLVVGFLGTELELLNDSTAYESFQVHIGPKLFVA